MLDYKQAADRLGVSDRTVRRLVDRGALRAVRVGGAVRFTPEEIDRYIHEQTGGEMDTQAAGGSAALGDGAGVAEMAAALSAVDTARALESEARAALQDLQAARAGLDDRGIVDLQAHKAHAQKWAGVDLGAAIENARAALQRAEIDTLRAELHAAELRRDALRAQAAELAPRLDAARAEYMTLRKLHEDAQNGAQAAQTDTLYTGARLREILRALGEIDTPSAALGPVSGPVRYS